MTQGLSPAVSPVLNNRRLSLKAGYTLMEILIVLAILALLATVVGPQLFKQFGGAKVKTATLQVKSLKEALDTMQLQIGRYPTQAEGLDLLVKAPGEGVANWSGPYLTGAAVPKDPWNNAYVYTPPANDGEQPTVTTLGEDGKPGGTGNAADISA
jgi:general secretion pathway protein G